MKYAKGKVQFNKSWCSLEVEFWGKHHTWFVAFQCSYSILACTQLHLLYLTRLLRFAVLVPVQFYKTSQSSHFVLAWCYCQRLIWWHRCFEWLCLNSKSKHCESWDLQSLLCVFALALAMEKWLDIGLTQFSFAIPFSIWASSGGFSCQKNQSPAEGLHRKLMGELGVNHIHIPAQQMCSCIVC